jgi:membrane protease YdiL (CAAX protease family)
MSAEHALIAPVERRTVRSRLVGAVRNRPLVAFFVLAFAFSWWPSILVIATGSGPPILGCGPFLAAVAVLALTVGKRGVTALLRSMLRWRVSVRWWAVAILMPVVLTALATALNVAFGAPMPTSEELARWTNVLPTALVILFVPIIGGAWEEPGWRGYALPRLLAARPALSASLVLGSLWAVWHVPLFLSGEQHWSDLVLVAVATVVFTWLFENASRSVLIAMVLHAMNNAVSGEYFSQMFTGADSTRQSWMLVVVWGAAALLVVVCSRVFRAGRSARAA